MQRQELFHLHVDYEHFLWHSKSMLQITQRVIGCMSLCSRILIVTHCWTLLTQCFIDETLILILQLGKNMRRKVKPLRPTNKRRVSRYVSLRPLLGPNWSHSFSFPIKNWVPPNNVELVIWFKWKFQWDYHLWALHPKNIGQLQKPAEISRLAFGIRPSPVSYDSKS
jgi:hypothetical protein